MSVKSDEKELQSQARKQKIKAILKSEGTPKANPKAESKAAPTYADEPLNWSPDEEQAHQAKCEEARRARQQREADEEAACAARSAVRRPQTDSNPYNVKLNPWERLSRNKMYGVQYRPLTSAEHDAVQDAAFLKKQFDADKAHADKIRRAEADAKAEQEATQKRAEQEATTGRRAYEPGRYISLEDARRLGYLGSGTGGENSKGGGGNEWSSPGNPDGIMCGGRR